MRHQLDTTGGLNEMDKLSLKGLIFSADEYFALRVWANHHAHEAVVEMPTRISRETLLHAIDSQEILNSTTDGILIVDHRKHQVASINSAVHTLGEHNKKFFATTNTLNPLLESELKNVDVVVNPVSADETKVHEAVRSTCHSDSSFLTTLEECTPALCWLDKVGPIDSHQIPEQCVDQIKRLEKMGLVYRRNKTTIGIQRQRLRKLLERESRGLSDSYASKHFVSNKSRH